MAYYVAEKLGLSPSVMLDEWTAPELIVTFGVYANEASQKNYLEWKQLDAKTKAGIPVPEEFVVKFIEA